MIDCADASYISDSYKSGLKQNMCSHVELWRSLIIHKSRHLLSLLLIKLKS